MRPQRFSCGIQAQTMRPDSGVLRFNEAAAFQLRNLTVTVGPSFATQRASMRPQRFSCGIQVWS